MTSQTKYCMLEMLLSLAYKDRSGRGNYCMDLKINLVGQNPSIPTVDFKHDSVIASTYFCLVSSTEFLPLVLRQEVPFEFRFE